MKILLSWLNEYADFGTDVELHQPRVPYLETIRSEARAPGGQAGGGIRTATITFTGTGARGETTQIAATVRRICTSSSEGTSARTGALTLHTPLEADNVRRRYVQPVVQEIGAPAPSLFVVPTTSTMVRVASGFCHSAVTQRWPGFSTSSAVLWSVAFGSDSQPA